MIRTAQPPSGRPADEGATLIVALIFTTVVAMVVAVVLTFADTSLRTTLALREQGARAAGADGAAQVAINGLRMGTFDGTSGACFGASNTLTLPDFYTSPGAAVADSAVVTCEMDPANSVASGIGIGPANKPRNAVLTTSTDALEDGLAADLPGPRDLKTHGDLFSNSNINVIQGSVTSSGSITARAACTGTLFAAAPPACNIGAGADPRGDDPDYAHDSGPLVAQVVPICFVGDQLLTFTPGLYVDIVGLNNIARCPNSILHFLPGTYYFDLPDTIPWLIANQYVVGGTATAPLVAGTPPTIPGSCVSPVPPRPIGGWVPPAANSGVQFVFGGGSRIILRRTQMELCGSFSTTEPPIALYGLKSAVGGVVPAQGGCTVVTPYPATGCATIMAEGWPNSRFYIQGTTYMPRAALNIVINNPSGAAFASGIIARSLKLTTSAGAGVAEPIVNLPDDSPPGRRTVVYLNAYICPGTNVCTSGTGALYLRAKIGIYDPSGVPVAGARQITVYSWSVIR